VIADTSGNAVHKAAVLALEQTKQITVTAAITTANGLEATRQAAIVTAQGAGSRAAVFAAVAAADVAYYAGMATRDAAIKAAEVAYFNSVAASALSNGISNSGEFVQAARNVGTHA
jgi:hypothetical protein